MIQEKSFTFKSQEGVTNISAKYWIPDDTPKAILQIAHGMVEYKERYDHFARFMAGCGFLVCANDHLGHGASIISTKKLGYMTKENPSDVLISDMQKLREIASTDYPNLPYFILGHSMGSFMLRKYLAKFSYGLSGAVIMGTGQPGIGASSAGLSIVKLLAKAKGWDYRSQFVQNLTYSSAYKEYDITGKDSSNSWLTRDASIVEKYYNDPKCTYLFTLSGHKGLFEATKFCGNDKNAKLISKSLPILLVSGEKDPVGDLGKGVKMAYDQLKNAGIEDVSLKLYPDCRHEILNELNKEDVYDDIYQWMNNLI